MLVFMSGALTAVLVVGVVPNTLPEIVPMVDADPADNTAMPGLTPSQLYEMTLALEQVYISGEGPYLEHRTEEVSSVVLVEVIDEWGNPLRSSGFFFDNERVLTAAHVIEDAAFVDGIRVYPGGRGGMSSHSYYEVDYVEVPRGADVAVLHVPAAEDLPPMPYTMEYPVVGEWVMAMGYPTSGWQNYGSVLRQSVGTVSAVDVFFGDLIIPAMVTSTLTASGMSGAPVVNLWGEVVGMHVGHMGEESGLAVVLRMEDILRVLEYESFYPEPGLITSPATFADHSKATVHNPLGSSVPGCEETDEGCFIPSTVTIDVGGEVTWVTDDGAAHTVTSGVLTDGGPDGVFDSGLFMPATSFSHKFEEAGEYPYFCLVHPWMEGLVIVQEASATDGDVMEDEPGESPP